jgi:palmitoyltransferase ZDHHC4
MVYDRHPTVLVGVGPVLPHTSSKLTQAPQIFFFLLLSVSQYLYLPAAWPRFDPINKVGALLAISFPYFFLYLAAFGDPGYVTPENHAYHMQLYPYDYSLFRPGSECRTCRLLKPARSKHCSVCKRCVSKMDHHCIFLNKCVGYGNHHHFILLLFSTAFLATYAALMGLLILSASIRADYPMWSLWKPSTNLSWDDWLLLCGWGMQDVGIGLAAVTLLTAMTAPMVWGLLAYTLFLVRCGTTTNESLKWSDWKADADDGCVFKRRMSPNRQRLAAVEPLRTRWPQETEQILINTGDGKPPPPGAPFPGEGEWQRVWKMQDVDNLYHLGFRDNLVDIFVPNKDFTEGRLPSMGRKKRSAKLMPF